MAKRPRYVVSRPQKRPVEARLAEIAVERLGARGDGIGHFNGTPVFIAQALPGERVLARIDGQREGGLTASVQEWIQLAPDRAKPACRHFGQCGGCACQHMKDATYTAWKRGIAVEALSRAGVAAEKIAPLMRTPPASRRRATFAWRKTKDGVVLGFNAKASHHIVDLQECPLLSPALTALLAPLRRLLSDLFKGQAQGDLSLQLADNGVDALIQTDAAADLFRREAIAKLVQETPSLLRVSWQTQDGTGPEPISEKEAPLALLGGVAVQIPPGAFLQPSSEGQAAITAQVLAGIGATRGKVADLYAGVGSFSLPLAAGQKVHAVEGDAAAAAALKRAGEKAALSQLSVERRDLRHRPLLAKELDAYQGVVLDPPRTGAREQVEELASTAKVERAVMVSCNPATLSRDIAILLQASWSLDSVVPIDQFLWTPHLELTAILHRK